MKPLPPPRSIHLLDLRFRKPIPRALAPLAGVALAAALLAAPLPAQARATAEPGPAFRLSSLEPGHAASPDRRDFTQAETLHMWLRAPLAKGGSDPVTGWWSLEGSTQTFSGELRRQGDGLIADFPLASVTEEATVWTWRASVEWKGQVIASPLAALRIELLTPRPAYVASVEEGEAPLSVTFEDHSGGAVTSWNWDFGDGQSSSEANPTHLYRKPGRYPVRLTVRGPFGEAQQAAAEPIAVREIDTVIAYGMNASENVWWQRGIAFADAMARAGEFSRVQNGVLSPTLAPLIPLDQDPPALGAGWPDLSALAPGEKAGARLFGSMGGTIPDGRDEPYVLTWSGTGSCRLDGLPVVGEANRGPNRVEVFVDPTSGGGGALLFWVVDSSDPSDPVRDVHVWLPGMEREKPILWPAFVDKLQAMNNGRGPVTWRAMDWNEVNQVGRTTGAAPFRFDYAGRITPASPSQGTKRGVCPEFQVALCNAVGANLHFNVPHAADGISDADYERLLRETFLRIRDGSPAVPGVNGGRPFEPLAPGLTLTLEFSNEIWNPQFPVNVWLKERSRASGRTVATEAALQIRRVFDVAESVFSGADAPRLRRFVGGWLGDSSFLLEVLSAIGPDVCIDAVGPAAYFGPRRDDIDAWMSGAVPGSCPNCPTPEEVVESARLRIQELDLKLLEHQLIALYRLNPDGSHPRVELYEGGSSFAAGFQPWGAAASQAQRLPSLYDAYVVDFVPELIARGVDVVNWYSFLSDGAQGSAGPFGHWERMNQSITLPVPEVYVDEGAPKAAAIYRLPPRRAP